MSSQFCAKAVCHANPDMPLTRSLALPTTSEREQQGGREEENMEGEAGAGGIEEKGDWER